MSPCPANIFVIVFFRSILAHHLNWVRALFFAGFVVILFFFYYYYSIRCCLLTRHIDFLFNYLLFTRFTWNTCKSIPLALFSWNAAFVCHKWQRQCSNENFFRWIIATNDAIRAIVLHIQYSADAQTVWHKWIEYLMVEHIPDETVNCINIALCIYCRLNVVYCAKPLDGHLCTISHRQHAAQQKVSMMMISFSRLDSSHISLHSEHIKQSFYFEFNMKFSRSN